MTNTPWKYHREDDLEIIDLSAVPKETAIRFAYDMEKCEFPPETIVRQLAEDILSIQVTERTRIWGLVLQCEGMEPDERSRHDWLMIDGAQNQWCSYPNEEFPRDGFIPLGSTFRVDVSLSRVDANLPLTDENVQMFGLLAQPYRKSLWRLVCCELDDIPRKPGKRKKYAH